MTREEYLAALKGALHTLPASDISDICGDFEEHFSIGLSQGKSEHEISAELGDPITVAGTYFDEGLEDIGHTMKESAAHAAAAHAAAAAASAAAASAASSANRPAVAASGPSGTTGTGGTSNTTYTSGTAGTTADAGTGSQQKDLTGARLFVILFNILVAWWAAITIYSTLLSFWGVSISLLVAGVGVFAAIAAASGGWIAVLVLSGIALVLLAIATGILNYFLSKWTIIGTKAYVNWNKKIYNEGF